MPATIQLRNRERRYPLRKFENKIADLGMTVGSQPIGLFQVETHGLTDS